MLNIKCAYPLLNDIKNITLKNESLNGLSGREFFVKVVGEVNSV
jgi:hypothetical protein